MNIQEFITETIKQIALGASSANEQIKSYGALLPDTSCALNINNFQYYEEDGAKRIITEVNFDIAVTVAQTEGSSIGGGIKVCGLNLGADSSNNSSNQATSRVQFKLNLVLPPTNSVKYNGQTKNAKP